MTNKVFSATVFYLEPFIFLTASREFGWGGMTFSAFKPVSYLIEVVAPLELKIKSAKHFYKDIVSTRLVFAHRLVTPLNQSNCRRVDQPLQLTKTSSTLPLITQIFADLKTIAN